MRISPHDSRTLDAIAHGAKIEIAAVLIKELDHIPGRQSLVAALLETFGPILDKRLREAYGWGVSYKDALPDEPVEWTTVGSRSHHGE